MAGIALILNAHHDLAELATEMRNVDRRKWVIAEYDKLRSSGHCLHALACFQNGQRAFQPAQVKNIRHLVQGDCPLISRFNRNPLLQHKASMLKSKERTQPQRGMTDLRRNRHD